MNMIPQTIQLTRIAKMTYVKSGVGDTNLPMNWFTCDGYQKNRTILAAVSVRIFTVLIIAKRNALCSCLSFANSIAVVQSNARIPPIYIIQFSKPA